jgi:hypothetical protein
MQTNILFWSHLVQFFLGWELFHKNEYKQSQHMSDVQESHVRKSCHLWDDVEKHCKTGQATDDNIAHAHWMLDT